MDNNNKPVQPADAGFYTQLAPNNLPVQRDDEIDLFELLQTLWRAKLQIILIAFFFMVLGGAYAFTATPIYSADFKITQVKSSDLYPINNSELVVVNPAQVIQLMREKFLSTEGFFTFYEKNIDRFPEKPSNMTNVQYANKLYKEDFQLLEPNAKKGETVDPFLGFQYQYPAYVEGHSILNDYLKWIDEQVKAELKQEFLAIVNNKLIVNEKKKERLLAEYSNDTEIKITRLKESDKFQIKELQDRLKTLKEKLIAENQQAILVLDENIAIARRLKFMKPTSPSDAKGDLSVNERGLVRAEFSDMGKLPLYFRGYESLEAEKLELLKRTKENFPSPQITEIERQIAMLATNREIEKLLTREKPADFMDAFVAIEQEVAHLKTLQLNEQAANLYVLQKSAFKPVKPIKPKKLLILILSGLLGGMFAVMFVLISSAIKNRQKPVEAAAS